MFSVVQSSINRSIKPHIYTDTAGPVSPDNMDADEECLLKHSTTLTNKHRGNEVTLRPATLDCKYFPNMLSTGANKAMRPSSGYGIFTGLNI